MNVRILGLSPFGEALERAQATLSGEGSLKKRRDAARAMARDYLEKWASVEFVAIRHDDPLDHRQIVKLRRPAPVERRPSRARA
jgi:regulator of PEP synthase PpsR (kinase-PPPase family)